MQEKNLQLERLVFFSDAVVAIAITLLALDIKIEHTTNGHISWSDIRGQWPTFVAFLLSFINIANFWKNHHSFFVHIKKIDDKLLWFNIAWLFFIVLLPFSTSLVGSYFSDTPAIFIYSLNTLLITVFQNIIWDYASMQPDYIKAEETDEITASHFRVYCNLDMLNALIAVGLSFWNPLLAFIMLLTKLPMVLAAGMLYRPKFKPERRRKKPGR